MPKPRAETCRECGSAPPVRKSGLCRECKKRDDKAYREANRLAVAASKQAWAVRNFELVRVQRAAKYAANQEVERAKRRAAYAADPGPAKERAAAWKLANPERHRELARFKQARRRARVTGSACGEATTDEIRALDPQCQACRGRAEHLDHIWPLSRGGCSAIHNLQWLCARCNLAKGAKTMSEWLGI